LSYAANATDPRFADLLQIGLTHDTYWEENVLHVGGSYSFARADRRVAAEEGTARRDLHSLNFGATLVLNYDWMLGASVTYDGTSGIAHEELAGISERNAWGAVVSLNYNRGPWTAGAFVQRSRREGTTRLRNDALTAFETGLSYRFSTKFRLYGAWYAFDFDDDGGARSEDRHHGQLLLVGVRATL
jgi:predicted porin